MAGQRKAVAWAGILVVVAVGGAALFIGSGAFDVAADESHSWPVEKLAGLLRERSIAVRASDIEIPPLDDPAMLMSGGADYNEMCSACHLAPGVEASELRDGMYPQPPDLTKTRRDPGRMFWIVKHGIKMSGMPAWGLTHDDARIWAMVAFIQQLPRLTPMQYRILTTRSEPGEDDDPEQPLQPEGQPRGTSDGP